MRTRALILAVVMVFAAGMALAQTTSPTPSSTNPSATSSQQQPSAATDQTSTSQSTTSNPNSAATAQQNTADRNANTSNTSNEKGTLPQTASPLPLLGLLGVGSLAAGVLSRRKK